MCNLCILPIVCTADCIIMYSAMVLSIKVFRECNEQTQCLLDDNESYPSCKGENTCITPILLMSCVKVNYCLSMTAKLKNNRRAVVIIIIDCINFQMLFIYDLIDNV